MPSIAPSRQRFFVEGGLRPGPSFQTISDIFTKEGETMAITVVGSVAYDSIETPAGRRERCLGGAATYFSLAASFFTDLRVIAVVGEDFGRKQEAVFAARNIDTRGIEHTAGKSFFWEGSYLENINEAKTRSTELNVFAS